jgi:hypothetical protein
LTRHREPSDFRTRDFEMREHRSSPVSGRASRGFWLVALVVATAAAMGLRLERTHHDASSDASVQIRHSADPSAIAAEPGADSFGRNSIGGTAAAAPHVPGAAAPSPESNSVWTTVTYDESGRPKLEAVHVESARVAAPAVPRLPEEHSAASVLKPRLDALDIAAQPASGTRLHGGLQGSTEESTKEAHTRPYLNHLAE